MFYEFNQNNSGGSFVFTDQVGVHTIIEAKDADDACERAVKNHGMWFDGVRDKKDCACCGDRWSRPWDDDSGTIGPSVYGMLPSGHMEAVDSDSLFEGNDGKDSEIVIHYMDGATAYYRSSNFRV